MPPEAAVQETEVGGLSAGELAYLESGGEKADGLLAEYGTPEPSPEPKVEPKAEPKLEPEPAKTASEPVVDPDEDDAIEVPDAKGGKPQRAIPWQKYDRERKKFKDQLDTVARENADLKEKFARGDERMRLLAEALAPKPEATAKAAEEEIGECPNPNDDIFGAFAWAVKKIGHLEGRVERTTTTVIESEADRQLRSDYQRDAVTFAQQKPDFVRAYNHLLTTRGAMLQDQGFDEQEIRKILADEEKGLVQRAKATGKSPAAMIYALSAQLGYRGEAPAAAPVASAAPAAAAGAVAEAAKTSVAAEIEAIQRGQAVAKSLSGSGGAASELSVESLANMSEKEFEQFLSSKGAKFVDSMLGKRH